MKYYLRRALLSLLLGLLWGQPLGLIVLVLTEAGAPGYVVWLIIAPLVVAGGCVISFIVTSLEFTDEPKRCDQRDRR